MIGIREHQRRCVLSAIDSLLGCAMPAEWVGNVVEVGSKAREQGHEVSDYMIRKVLREFGESIGHGQYRITRECFARRSR